MIRVYCKFCLMLVDTLEVKEDNQILVVCKKCKEVIGYTFDN